MIHLQQNTLKQLLAMYRAFPGTFCFLSLFSAAATFNRTKTLSESAEESFGGTRSSLFSFADFDLKSRGNPLQTETYATGHK